jgi:catechol 2,3-dioxygenase
MQTTADLEDRLYLKTWDEWDHHSVLLRQSDSPGLVKMGFKVETLDDLANLEGRVEQYGLHVTRHRRGEELSLGDSFTFESPSGHIVELYTEMELVGKALPAINPDPWPDNVKGIGVPRLDHLLVTCEDVAGATNFFKQVLGFSVSEQLVTDLRDPQLIATWMFRTNTTHDIAFVRGANGKLHHFAFWLDDWNEIRRAGDIMVKNDVKIDIGPTRHGITRGNTIYFFDPSGNRNEVYTGGPACYPDMPTVTWTADRSGRGIFYYEREVPERFLKVYT